MFRVVAGLGDLHALVNGVGSACSGGLRDLNVNDWQRKFDLNLTSVLLCSQAALPLLEQRVGDRVIVNLSSTLARVADPDTLAYGAFKAALEHMTRSMALELAPQNIRVVAVAPGPVAATGGEAAWEQERYVRLNPLCRFATADEIAGIIAFLLSPAACYITGTTISVDGGDSALGIGWGTFNRLDR
jgi:NAD(P)-dependent dehydrogenase (short-subunit alcohol dehydrogenase family)